MPTLPPMSDTPDTVYVRGDRRVCLKRGRYSRVGPATLLDDGIVDPVAVLRVAEFDRPAALTGREVVAAIFHMATDGHSDPEIALALDDDPAHVARLRRMSGIPAGLGVGMLCSFDVDESIPYELTA